MSGDHARLNRREVLLGAASVATVHALASPAYAGTHQQLSVRHSQTFDLGWRFLHGAVNNYESSNLDDSGWREVVLPHDWSIEDLRQSSEPAMETVGPFDPGAEGGTATGFTVGGESWYRKHFHLSMPAKGRVEILFEGVYSNCDVWLNAHHLGSHVFGYTSFSYDLTPHLARTGENVLALRARNRGKNSRWYSGSGIYRHVWLDFLPEHSRISRWGVGIITRQITDRDATIDISTRTENAANKLTITSRIVDGSGRVVAQGTAPALAETSQSMIIASPRLWSPDEPSLHTLETELRRNGALIDRIVNTFGVRIVTFDSQRGMLVNGEPTKLRGGCIHHDNGLLGAASFDEAEERKVRLLKERGFNAVRPSHNPFSPAFLRACDTHGLFVVAETFDAWREHKLPQDYALNFDSEWRNDLRALVLSARNHPSIVMWSIGNEIPGRNSAGGVETQWDLANEAHMLDPSRPVTAAINGFAGRHVTPSEKAARLGLGDIQDRASTVFLDVVGYNYKLADYEEDHLRWPQRVFFGTESYPKDVVAIWDLTNKSPWLIGDFVWTAMDYLGEAGIGGSVVLEDKDAHNPLAQMPAWPWVNAFCGDLDLVGDQKPQSLARDVMWGVGELEAVVQRPTPAGKGDVPRSWGWHDEQPSWTWPGTEGKPLTVRVCTSGDRIDLRLNGRALDSKPVFSADSRCVKFAVPYEAGALEAVAFRDGKEIARNQLVTTGPPTAIRLQSERSSGGSQRGDVTYVSILIIDSHDRVVADPVYDIKAHLHGPAELIAFGAVPIRSRGVAINHQPHRHGTVVLCWSCEERGAQAARGSRLRATG